MNNYDEEQRHYNGRSSDIENSNLEAHVSICQVRYEALERRLTAIENRIGDMGNMITDIRDSIQKINKGQTDEWTRFRDIVIAMLFAGMIYTSTKLWFY